MVRHIADRVAVMYLGRIVEIGDVDAVFDSPTHPYTQALLSAIPIPDPDKERSRRRILLTGDLPSPLERPSGCRFRTRCPKFIELDDTDRQRCIDEDPALRGNVTAADDHEAACHFADVVRRRLTVVVTAGDALRPAGQPGRVDCNVTDDPLVFGILTRTREDMHDA